MVHSQRRLAMLWAVFTHRLISVSTLDSTRVSRHTCVVCCGNNVFDVLPCVTQTKITRVLLTNALKLKWREQLLKRQENKLATGDIPLILSMRRWCLTVAKSRGYRLISNLENKHNAKMRRTAPGTRCPVVNIPKPKLWHLGP